MKLRRRILQLRSARHTSALQPSLAASKASERSSIRGTNSKTSIGLDHRPKAPLSKSTLLNNKLRRLMLRRNAFNAYSRRCTAAQRGWSAARKRLPSKSRTRQKSDYHLSHREKNNFS